MAKKKMSFEEALKQIEDIVERLDSFEIPLEEAVSLYKEGMNLSIFCKEKLMEAEKEVLILKKDFEGKDSLQKYDIPEDKNAF